VPTTPIEFSARAAALAPSATLAMVQRVRELRDQGVEILSLTAGEPDFGPPTAAEAAGIAAIRAGQGRYTPAAGTAELREAVAKHIREDIGLSYSPSEIVVTHGAKIAIAQAMLALVGEGDEVILPTPCWSSYPEIVKLAAATPIAVKCDKEGVPQLAALEAARTERTRAILLNTPSNPTGAVLSHQVVREIGEWALQHGIWLISDEIYAALVYGDARHVSPMLALPELQHRAVWIGGMSKAYAMTGWRMGFAAAPAALAKKIGAVQSQLAGSPCAISQLASLAALREGGTEREAMRRTFEKRCTLVIDALRAMPGISCPQPDGAFYAFPSIAAHLGKSDPASGKRLNSGDDFIELLLEADQVACIGGTAFGQPDSFRISFATDEKTLREALARISARLQSLC